MNPVTQLHGAAHCGLRGLKSMCLALAYSEGMFGC